MEVVHALHVPGFESHRAESLTTLPDLVSTCLDLVGVDIPKETQGISLLPLMKGEVDQIRYFVVTSWPLTPPGEITYAVTDSPRKVAEPMASTITTDEQPLIYSGKGEPNENYRLTKDKKTN